MRLESSEWNEERMHRRMNKVHTIVQRVGCRVARRGLDIWGRDGRADLLGALGSIAGHVGGGSYLGMSEGRERGKEGQQAGTGRTRLGRLFFRLIVFLFPGGTVAADEAGDAFRVDVLPVDAEGRLFAFGGALSLFADHEMDFFGLDVFANVPGGEAIFVLFLSGRS